jgi:hypothetical protein
MKYTSKPPKKKQYCPSEAARDIFELTGFHIGEEFKKLPKTSTAQDKTQLYRMVLKALLQKIDFFPDKLLLNITGVILSYKKDILENHKKHQPTFEL